jgi:hypothetical protein
MCLRVHTIIAVLVTSDLSQARGDEGLESLIAEIEREEARYAELEFVASSTFFIADDHPANADLTPEDMLAEECRAEYSVRDHRWHFHAERTSHYLLRDERRSCVGVWSRTEELLLVDVVETEVVSNQQISSTITGYVHEVPRPLPTNLGGGRFIHPHMVWTEAWAGPPLSAFLRGRDGIQDALSTKIAFTISVEDVSEADWEGLRCRLLRLDLLPDQGGEGHSFQLWLACERNLIPIRVDWYFGTGDAAVHRRSSTILEWHQVADGVYFPKRVHDENYDTSIDSPDRGQLPVSQREWVIESISTTCNRPDSDFDSLEFPEGIEVIRP